MKANASPMCLQASALVTYSPGLKKNRVRIKRAKKEEGLRRRLRDVGEGDAATAVKANYTS